MSKTALFLSMACLCVVWFCGSWAIPIVWMKVASLICSSLCLAVVIAVSMDD